MSHRVPALSNSVIQASLLFLGACLLTLQGLLVCFVYSAPQGAFPWAQSSQGAESGGAAESQFLRSPSPFLCQVGAYILLCVLSPISAGVFYRIDSSRLSVDIVFYFSELLIFLVILYASHFEVVPTTFVVVPAILVYRAIFSLLAQPPLLGDPLSVAETTLSRESLSTLIPELLGHVHGASESLYALIPQLLGHVHGAAGTLLAILWRRERRPGSGEEMEEGEQVSLETLGATRPYNEGMPPPPYIYERSHKLMTFLDEPNPESPDSLHDLNVNSGLQE